MRVGVPAVVEPFIFGGVGWQHFNETGPAAIRERSDNTVAFPFGGGVEASLGSAILGARFTYDVLNNSNVIANAAKVSLWTATANLGAAF